MKLSESLRKLAGDALYLESYVEERENLVMRMGEVRTVALEMREQAHHFGSWAMKLTAWAQRLDPEEVGTPDRAPGNCLFRDLGAGEICEYQRILFQKLLEKHSDGRNCVEVNGLAAGRLSYIAPDTPVKRVALVREVSFQEALR